MAENSGFFDAHLTDGKYDRVYLAENFARYFANFIGNGVFGGKSNELMVRQKEAANMSVRVLSGQGWINGYWYENTDELSLAIDVADGVLNRIDSIVLRWDNVERVIRLAVKKGTPSSTAYPSSVLRNADFYELKLAEVYVKAGATSITQADITDTRLDNTVCGLVQGVVQQFDTTEFGKQIDSFIENFEATNIVRMNEVLARLNAMADENDVASLIFDIEILKALFTESDEFPGCYYRLTPTGEKEWVNPPVKTGIEYRLTERWGTLPVYQKMFHAATLPNKSVMGITVDFGWDKVISVDGFAQSDDDAYFYPFPVVINGLTPAAVITKIEGDGGTGGTIVIQTNEDLSYLKAYITVKYVKTR